jgi:hypothetical protein
LPAYGWHRYLAGVPLAVAPPPGPRHKATCRCTSIRGDRMKSAGWARDRTCERAHMPRAAPLRPLAAPLDRSLLHPAMPARSGQSRCRRRHRRVRSS